MHLSEYIKQIRGVSYKPNDVLSISMEGYIPLLRANNINDGKINFDNLVYVKEEKVKENQILKKGDILVCASSGSRDLVGKAATFDNDFRCTFGAFCKVIRANNINEKYLSVFFQSDYYRKNISQNSRGANINNLKQEDFDKLLIKVPTVAEQEKIAVKINKIIDLIGNKKNQIELMNQLIKSQFVEMFGGKDFEKRTLQEITTKITDGSHNPPSGIAENLGYMMLSSQNIINDKINYDNARYLSRKDFEKENMRTNLKNGDILLTIVGTVGRTAIIRNEENITLQRSVAVLKPIKEIKSDYLVNALKSDDFVKQLNKGAKGVAQKGIYLSDLKKLTVLVPPIDLQNKFAQFVEQIDKQKFEFEKSLKKLEELQASLMQEYFG